MALQRLVGNRAVTAMLSERRVLQRKPEIGKRDEWNFRDAQIALEDAVRRLGYSYSNRLWTIVTSAFGFKHSKSLAASDQEIVNAIATKKYDTWDDFVEDLATRRAISGRIPSAHTKTRAFTLARPKWAPRITEQRAERKAASKGKGKGKGTEAARHIIPSHTLGYAIERWGPSRADVEKWLEAVPQGAKEGIGQPKRQTDLAWRQYAFAIVHNHMGNLWWGGSTDNSAIGFVAPHLESARNKLEKLEDLAIQAYAEVASESPEEDSKQLKEGVLKVAAKLMELGSTLATKGGPLQKRFEELAESVHGLVDPIKTRLDSGEVEAHEAFSELMDAIEDIFDQTEFDPPDALNPDEITKARKLYDALVRGEVEEIPDQLIAFLNTNYIGSMAPVAASSADTGNADQSESESESGSGADSGSDSEAT